MSTPLFDQSASLADEAAWKRWRNMPDNEAMLLTKRELAEILEVMLSLSAAIEAKSGAIEAKSGAAVESEPMHQLVKSILNVSDRKVVIDGGAF